MTMKTFTSTNTEEALEKVAREFGEDAYIIKTEKVDGLVTVTASNTAPSPVERETRKTDAPLTYGKPQASHGSFHSVISSRHLSATLIFGRPGCGKTSFIYKFLLDRQDSEIHYLRDGQNNLLANSNSAVAAGLLECNFSYHPIETNMTTIGTPIIESDLGPDPAKSIRTYREIAENYSDLNIFYLIDSFEGFRLDILENLKDIGTNIFIIYNKKDPVNRNYLKKDFVNLISACFHKPDQEFSIAIDRQEIEDLLVTINTEQQ
jgi:hypothetical protein